jgi:serine/threonine protein kinase
MALKSQFTLNPKPTRKIEENKSKKDKVSQRSLAGTPMYQSPEQRALISGNDLKQKRTSDIHKLQQDKIDIYAAGLVLFEMCGNFRTDMERYSAMDNLQKRREFPKGFTEKYH